MEYDGLQEVVSKEEDCADAPGTEYSLSKAFQLLLWSPQAQAAAIGKSRSLCAREMADRAKDLPVDEPASPLPLGFSWEVTSP